MNNFEKAVKLMSELFQAQSRDEAKLEYTMAILNEMAEEDIESATLLDREQKERRKRLAADALDALKRYIKQCFDDNDEISENEFLDILHNSIDENGVSWRLYRRSLSDLEFNMTEQEYERLVKEFKAFE